MAHSTHREEFIHLVDLAHDRVLIAWGAFFFTRSGPDRRWQITDDEQLGDVGRRTCIGSGAESFGDATVRVLGDGGEVVAEASTSDRTWVWLEGLQPDTEYRYQVEVAGKHWADGERWDWVPSARGGYDLAPAGRRYDLRFRTWPHPDAQTPAMRFVALGDYGVGIRSDSAVGRLLRGTGLHRAIGPALHVGGAARSLRGGGGEESEERHGKGATGR